MNRYQELKKENNQMCSYLSAAYQNVGLIFIKKARKFGVNSEDTEIKIKYLLEELTSFDEKHIHISEVIPNVDEYIELNLRKISKAVNKYEKVKTIIGLGVIIVICLGWFALSQYFGRSVKFEAPTNFRYTYNHNGKIVLSWDSVYKAEQYYLYYKDKDGNKSATRYLQDLEYAFTLEKGEEYTFYLGVCSTIYFKESDPVILKTTIK